jgi:hypothetical protein
MLKGAIWAKNVNAFVPSSELGLPARDLDLPQGEPLEQ